MMQQHPDDLQQNSLIVPGLVQIQCLRCGASGVILLWWPLVHFMENLKVDFLANAAWLFQGTLRRLMCPTATPASLFLPDPLDSLFCGQAQELRTLAQEMFLVVTVGAIGLELSLLLGLDW